MSGICPRCGLRYRGSGGCSVQRGAVICTDCKADEYRRLFMGAPMMRVEDWYDPSAGVDE